MAPAERNCFVWMGGCLVRLFALLACLLAFACLPACLPGGGHVGEELDPCLHACLPGRGMWLACLLAYVWQRLVCLTALTFLMAACGSAPILQSVAALLTGPLPLSPSNCSRGTRMGLYNSTSQQPTKTSASPPALSMMASCESSESSTPWHFLALFFGGWETWSMFRLS